MKKFVAGCCQLQVLPGAIDTNLKKIEAVLPQFADGNCRLLVLPEMFSCGFDYSCLPRMADETPSVIEILQGWARRYGIVLVGSLPEAAEEKVYNTSYVIEVDGTIAGIYRKVHLFSLHDEHLYFRAGGQSCVCETSIGRLGIMICYDLRFPELARALALKQAEILCISAQWPTVRIDHWSLLLKARAVENQLFVVGCNGCGPAGRLILGGHSAIISPSGRTIAEANDGESYLLGEVNFAEMASFREKIPCLADRVPASYDLRNET